jgi:hypothetical protein
MTLQRLYDELNKLKVPTNWYYLHGLYGDTDDNDKLSLTIYKPTEYSLVYEVYFKEKGEKNSIKRFATEMEACEHIFKELKDQKLMENIRMIEGLSAMSTNERLFAAGLIAEFEEAKNNNKGRARTILRLLQVDEKSINQILR